MGTRKKHQFLHTLNKMKYTEIKNEHAVLKDAFFAFNNEQFAEGLAKFNLKKEDVRSGNYGLYGTAEGIKTFLGFYDEQKKRISEECTPQEVYDHEYWNHECEYTGDDTEAVDAVEYYFGIEKMFHVKRKGYYGQN
jgi:hypothetical protein